MPAMTIRESFIKKRLRGFPSGSLAMKQIKFLFLKGNNELRQRRKYQISCWSTLFQKVIFVIFKQFEYLQTLFTTFDFSILHFNLFFSGKFVYRKSQINDKFLTY